METVVLRIGDILKIDDVDYVIICIKNKDIILVEKYSSSIIFYVDSYANIEASINNGSIIYVSPPGYPYVDIKTLSKSKAVRFKNKVKLINDLTEKFGPTFLDIMSKDNRCILDNSLEKYGFRERTCWNVIRKYLQSGLNVNALVDQRNGSPNIERKYKAKVGKKPSNPLGTGIIVTPEVKKHFDEALKNYLSGRSVSMKVSYDLMLVKYYSYQKSEANLIKRDILPVNERPTINQFYNYCRQKIENDKLYIAKNSKQEYRNNERLLLSDSLIDADGPMSICEIDECEADIFLVSEQDPEMVVGRPIIYAMIDVYSRMIVAVSISFENNSIRGFTNCMLNLIDNKKELCQRYDIDISSNLWVDHYLPQRIRCDYGSEYISKEVQRICNELNIQKENVSPGTGSLKGIVEQSFNQYHSKINWVTEGKGLIEKRNDSNHKKEAMLNIEEYKTLVYASVATHNSRYNKNYPLTKTMMRNKVKPIPAEIWKYGIEHYGSPKSIINDDNFRFALLEDANASISRDGVTYKKLKYINTEDEFIIKAMKKAGVKHIPIKCRIDSRCIDNLYFLDNGTIHVLYLNILKTGMESFKGMCLYEYEQLLQEKLESDKNGDDYNRHLDTIHEQISLMLMKKSKKDIHPSSKNLKENRRKEKYKKGKEEHIMKNYDNDIQIATTDNKQSLNEEENQYTSLIKKLEELNK